jgi:SMI1 / KNR4 family (SUKH-1)
MPESLTQRLAPLNGTHWYSDNPNTEHQLAAVDVNHAFPDDYRELMLAGGGEIVGENSRVVLMPLRNLQLFNPEPNWEDLRDMFVFAEDAGDYVYFYDPTDRLGRGGGAVFAVAKGSPHLRHAIYVARDLTHLVDRILVGDDVLDS